ncbi:anthrone oxygenase family protein [Altericista sp. CCNU0014]|uniref:anthrone oxygenase family protein n=1 Tax=Altericista sp. CCNU0014 TaxID=3082949 RepID=UPI00384E6949
MFLVQISLGIAIVSTGLFTGLVLTMLFIFQPLLDRLSATEYAELMQRFLKVARRSPLNIALMLISIFAPIPALFGFYQSSNWRAFGLASIGLTIFFVGMFWVSRFFNEPLYDQILGWTVQSPPPDWQAARQQWYVLNLVRGWASGSAFVLFLITLNL